MLLPHALRCLQHANVRRFFAGQSISLVGSWMQSVAMGWLVYRLTGKSQMLGLVAFLSQVPVFLFATWAGSLADRVDRRRMVMATQANALVQATLLAALTFSGLVQVWHLMVLSVMLGLTYAFEIPARQALLADIAGADTPNAVALNSTVVNVARVAGPALAGLLVASVGEAWCFALNAVSFVATLSALARMQGLARPAVEASRGWRHLADGVAYARRTVMVRALLSLSLVASFFALPY
ncbi:MAG TPA: MFS transporter, partial [Aggregicoccus sp.]|nr:MFS transporter [Aggregicoccus sp.]